MLFFSPLFSRFFSFGSFWTNNHEKWIFATNKYKFILNSNLIIIVAVVVVVVVDVLVAIHFVHINANKSIVHGFCSHSSCSRFENSLTRSFSIWLYGSNTELIVFIIFQTFLHRLSIFGENSSFFVCCWSYIELGFTPDSLFLYFKHEIRKFYQVNPEWSPYFQQILFELSFHSCYIALYSNEFQRFYPNEFIVWHKCAEKKNAIITIERINNHLNCDCLRCPTAMKNNVYGMNEMTHCNGTFPWWSGAHSTICTDFHGSFIITILIELMPFVNDIVNVDDSQKWHFRKKCAHWYTSTSVWMLWLVHVCMCFRRESIWSVSMCSGSTLQQITVNAIRSWFGMAEWNKPWDGTNPDRNSV